MVQFLIREGTMTTSNWRTTLKLVLPLLAIGIFAISGVNILISQRLSSALTDGLLAREGEVTQEFLSSILAAEHGEGALFAQPGPSAALDSFSEHVRGLPGLVRANIYSPDGFIRYSTDANLIGVQFADNDELAEAFGGKIISVLETQAASGKAEHLALGQISGEKLIEAYVPVAGADGKIVTVVEFYRKDRWIEIAVSDVERSFLWTSLLGSAVLASGLFALLFAWRRST